MDNIVGELETSRSKPDSIVMRILKSAMDKAHKKVQSKDGPIAFLHERSKFYELAAILVEGGLSIIQEEADIPEKGREKILSDLLEIRQWLRGRLKVMKLLISEKDKDVIERIENELKLKQALELKERELACLHEKLELERTKSNEETLLQEFQLHNAEVDSERGKEGEIFKLKFAVDQQIWSIKQKLDDKLEKGIDNNDLENLRFDIDILKENLDLMFERMQKEDTFSLEKEWRWSIEKNVSSIMMKRFFIDLQQNDSILAMNGRKIDDFAIHRGFSPMLMSQIVTLRDVLHDFHKKNGTQLLKELSKNNHPSNQAPTRIQRAQSEPLHDSLEEDEDEDNDDEDKDEINQESEGWRYVARLVKNHESMIKKHQLAQWNWLKKVPSANHRSNLFVKKDHEKFDDLEKQIQETITRLDNIIRCNNVFLDNFCKKENFQLFQGETMSSLENGSHTKCQELTKRIEGPDDSDLEIVLLEEIYILLLEGLRKDLEDQVHVELESFSYEIMLKFLESKTKADVYQLFIEDKMKWLVNVMRSVKDECVVKEQCLRQAMFDLEDMESNLLQGDVHIVLLKEMVYERETARDDYEVESLNRDNIWGSLMIEAVKDASMPLDECQKMMQTNYSKVLPSPKKLNLIEKEDSFVHKLDCVLKCVEMEEELMLRARSEIKEHSASHDEEILKCEAADERIAIEWLLINDEITFGSVNEKLELAMKQLLASKLLLVELEQDLGILPNETALSAQSLNISKVEDKISERDLDFEQDSKISEVPEDPLICSSLIQFQHIVINFEQSVHDKLDIMCSRVDHLKQQLDAVQQEIILLRERKLVYKNAFKRRCRNLLLAEKEVDLLGDQVDLLLCLLERIYLILDKNSTFCSQYFEVTKLVLCIYCNQGNALLSMEFLAHTERLRNYMQYDKPREPRNKLLNCCKNCQKLNPRIQNFLSPSSHSYVSWKEM